MDRIRYIDALRGFTMLLVVFGHVMMISFGIGGYNTVIGSFFLTFRMPIFFFISGYIAYKCVNQWNMKLFIQLVKKKAFVQIIPATIFFILFRLCFMGGSVLDVLKGIPDKGFLGYWFTFVLFEMFCVYYTALLIGKYTRSITVDTILIVCSLVGILWLNVSSRGGVIYKVLCFENFAIYLQFFTFGILCRKYNKQFISLVNNDIFRSVIIGGFVICFYFYYDFDLKESNRLLFALNHDIVVRYLGLLTLFIFFWKKSEYFNKDTALTRCMLFVGRRTLDIYLLHFFFLPKLLFLTPYIESTSMMLVQLLFSLIIAAFVVGVCLLVSEVIRCSNTLAYICFGVKKK